MPHDERLPRALVRGAQRLGHGPIPQLLHLDEALEIRVVQGRLGPLPAREIVLAKYLEQAIEIGTARRRRTLDALALSLRHAVEALLPHRDPQRLADVERDHQILITLLFSKTTNPRPI